MTRVSVTFQKLIQDSQEFGSNDEHMVSRVFFSLEMDGKNLGNFYADLKQAVGGDITKGEIEVGPPKGYDGPLDHHSFSAAARKCFGMLVGGQASGIRIGSGVKNLRMHNNVFTRTATFNL